jgi:hypothetical protein
LFFSLKLRDDKYFVRIATALAKKKRDLCVVI